MSEKKEYPELRKELNRLVELQQQNQLTNDADKLIVELTSVLQSTPSPALQDAVKDSILKRCDCEDCYPVEIKVCKNCDGYIE